MSDVLDNFRILIDIYLIFKLLLFAKFRIVYFFLNLNFDR